MNHKDETKAFGKMCEVNPTLKLLDNMCGLIHMDHQNSLSQYWYETIKPIMVQNVGDMCPHAGLKSSEAYDLVYRHLTKKLGLS